MTLKLSEEIAGLEQNRGKYDKVFPGYITHIRFPRFKNIADGTHIEFSFPIAALVGANGSGKTSVLNALYGAPAGQSTGQYWFSTKVDPIEEGRAARAASSTGTAMRISTRSSRHVRLELGRPGMVCPTLTIGSPLRRAPATVWSNPN